MRHKNSLFHIGWIDWLKAHFALMKAEISLLMNGTFVICISDFIEHQTMVGYDKKGHPRYEKVRTLCGDRMYAVYAKEGFSFTYEFAKATRFDGIASIIATAIVRKKRRDKEVMLMEFNEMKSIIKFESDPQGYMKMYALDEDEVVMFANK